MPVQPILETATEKILQLFDTFFNDDPIPANQQRQSVCLSCIWFCNNFTVTMPAEN